MSRAVYRKVLLRLGFSAALFAMATSTGGAQKPEYAVAARFALHKPANGTEGALRLLLDKRFTESVRNEVWGNGEWSFVFPEDSPKYKAFSAMPPGNAKLTVCDKTGRVVADREL